MDNTTKIDLKDRKILYELDLNARQSLNEIGKKVGLNKDSVAYRIKRMEDEGIIKKYSTVIDAFKLGYNVFRVYLQLQDIPLNIKKEIIKNLVEYKHSWSVYSAIGPFDLGFIAWIKNIHEFYQFYNGLLNKYSKYVAQKTVSIYVQADEYEKTYLISKEHIKTERKKFTIINDGKTVQIDETDYKILNEIALNARISITDLADKLKCSPQTINYRLNNLIKSGVIKGFRVNIDVSKLGLEYFDVRINLKDHSQRMKIINYIKNNPHFKCLNTTIGYSDLETEFIVENMDKLNKIVEDITIKFPEIVRTYFYAIPREIHKERWLPEMY